MFRIASHIEDVVNRFVRTGFVQKGKSLGRPAVSTEGAQEVRQVVEQNPYFSLHRISP